MKKLKIILLLSIILFITYKIYHKPVTKYKNETNIIGTIKSIKYKEDYTIITLKSKEKILVYLYEINKDIKLGDTLYLKGNFKNIKKNTNFNTFNYKNYLLSKKIYTSFEINKIIKIKKNKNIFYLIKNNIINKINNYKSKDYLYAFILGDINYINKDIYNIYLKMGINHLFAISGMHISLISLILLKILSKISKKQILIYFIIFIFLLFYSFLVNFTPGVLRSTFSFILIFLNKIFKLKIKNENILIMICIIFLLYNPYYIYNTGFIYSFVISYFLIKENNYKKNKIINIIYLSFISFIVSLPILINTNYQINLLTIFYNTIFIPFISLIMFPLSILTFFIKELDFIFNYLINFLEFIIIYLEKISIYIIIRKLTIIEIIIYYIFIKNKKIIFIYIFIIYISSIYTIYPSLTLIDVGQGDSSLLRINNKNILIDTGGNKYYHTSKDTITYLKSLGIRKIDYLILTHGDFDHLGDSLYFINNFKVNKIFINSTTDNIIEKNLIKKGAKKIDNYKLYIGKYIVYLLSMNDINENDNSIVTYTNLNNHNIILMGDATKKVENYLINEYNLPKMDILKVGHHGSKTSTSENFLKIVNPKYALISVGKNNNYGHPNKEVINRLKNKKVYTTKDNGMIHVKFKKVLTWSLMH